MYKHRRPALIPMLRANFQFVFHTRNHYFVIARSGRSPSHVRGKGEIFVPSPDSGPDLEGFGSARDSQL